MSGPGSGVLGGWLLVLLVATPISAQEVRYGDVVVRTLPDLPQTTTHGYHEFPFLVTNESRDRPHRVTVTGPEAAQVAAGLHSLGRLGRTVLVSPGASVRLALFQPPLPIVGSRLAVHVDGRRQRERLPWSSAHPQYWSGMHPGLSKSRRVLISQSLSEAGFPPHSDEDYLVGRAVTATAAWSESWLAYSGFDGVVTTAGDLERAPAPVVEALWRYVETGGSVLVLGTPEPDSAWGRARRTRPQASVVENGLAVDYAGFGAALVAAGAREVDDLSSAQMERLEIAWIRSRDPWERARDPAGTHRDFPVADKVEVPVRGLFLVVLIFTVLIGPVNLVVLTRRRKRMWLLWTVPAASLLTCGLVAVSVLAGEGLVRFRRTEALTLLDETTRRATTLGWTGYYSTLTPGGGLRFDAETEVTPILELDFRRGGDSARTVEWGDGQHLSLGWVRARVPAYFVVRKSELRRERIVLRTADDGGIEAVNGLGTDLEALWVADRRGRLHIAGGPLPAGAAVRLRPTGETSSAVAGAVRDLYRADLMSRLRRLTQQPARYLRPGTYLAVAADSPFLEAGLGDVDRATLQALIYGIAEGDGP